MSVGRNAVEKLGRASLGLALLCAWVAPASAQASPDSQAWFGELHIHSSWSLDAYIFGTKLGPDDATRFARGEKVMHPGGFEVQLPTPLDFSVVMDHSEYTGAFVMADDPESPLRKNAPLVASMLRFGVWANGMDLYKLLSISILKDKPIKELQSAEVAGLSWQRIAGISEAHNVPGTFTTFPGWEWTATPNFKNLHRIVFFKDGAKVSAEQFSSLTSTDPVELWKWMDAQRAAGNDVVAVSHNGNLSDGALYPRHSTEMKLPFDSTYAANRTRNEPVAEIAQVKGQSETTPALSPGDEFANFNIFVWMLLGAKGVPTEYGSYIRLALRDGIAMQGALGFNPYKFGVVAGSDAHSAVSAYRNDDYFGEHSLFDDTTEKRLSSKKELNMDNRQVCTAGLTGIWADENTRDSLWDALHRKETFATSGLRMKVRMFGGWDFAADSMQAEDWVTSAYAHGVPMGGDLPEPTPGARAPTFLVEAENDPSAQNLDRVQIIKGWAINGQSFEQVYDVAWAGDRKADAATGKVPAINSTVDIGKGTYTNTTGTARLSAVWTDPDFEAGVDAFYYARALLIPTPRWSTIQAAQQGVVPPSVVPLTLQDRAWSSPIWYTPSAQARAAAPQGLTVAGLLRQGAKPLNDDELNQTIVGKTVQVHNLVTGRKVDILYGVAGQRLITAIDGQPLSGNQLGDLMFDAQTEFVIAEGQVITHMGGTPFAVSLYQLGDRLLAARGEEFGCVNYEVTLVGQ